MAGSDRVTSPSRETGKLGDCDSVAHAFPHSLTPDCVNWTNAPAARAFYRAPSADRETLPPEVDCTTPETCGICHRCQEPEPHECVVSVPRETLDRWERAMGVLMGGAGWETSYECGHGVAVLARCPEKRCPLDPVRVAIAEVRRLRGEGR